MGAAIVSRNLRQGEGYYFLMPLPHDIADRTRVRPRPVDWLVTYLGNCEATRHSQGGCKPEYDRFNDRRSKIVKCYDVGCPRSGPPCITVGEDSPHEEANRRTCGKCSQNPPLIVGDNEPLTRLLDTQVP
jgi:hypothetical protein